MKAKSIKGKTVEEIGSALNNCMAEGMKPTLAVVFMPEENTVRALCELLDKKGIAIFGASSFGQFIDCDFDTDSIVVMLLDIKPDHFRIEFRETGNTSTKEIAGSIGEAGRSAFKKPAFVVASGGVKTDGEKILEGIQEVAGRNVTLFGGLAASDLKSMHTFVFTNKKIFDDGLVALILDEEKISVNCYATGGCQPVGIYHTITNSDGNIVYTIDDQPVLDLILRYCGKGIDELKEGNAILIIASYFQIQLERRKWIIDHAYAYDCKLE